MVSVTLIDRDGSEWEVRSPAALTEAVFRDGMRLKAGTLEENMTALMVGFTVIPTLNEPILKRDVDTDEEREHLLPSRLTEEALIDRFGGGGTGGAAPDATASIKGVLRLTGDLGGTAASPTVPGLAGKANTASLHAVATSGLYTDLTGRPTIPAAYSDEQARDAVSAMLVEGANVTLVKDDAANTVSISAAGEGAAGPWVNAKTDHGATGNGTTNDTAALQAAINAAVAAKRTLYLPAGTYVSGALTVPGSLTMIGEGTASTILRVAAGTNAYLLTYSGAGNDTRCTFSAFTIDGNGSNQTAGGGINAIGAVEHVFDKLRFINCHTYGLRIAGFANGDFGHHNRITGCLFDATLPSAGLGAGVLLTSADENWVTDCDFQYLGGGVFPSAMVHDQAGLQMIQDCVFVGSQGNNRPIRGVWLDTGNRSTVRGCIFDGVGGDNVFVKGVRHIVEGNRFTFIGDQGNATASGVHFEFGAQRNLVIGNQFEAAGTAGKTRSYIRESDGDPGNNLVAGNNFEDSTVLSVGKLELRAAAAIPTRVVDNIGYADTSGPSVTSSAPAASYVAELFAGDVYATDVTSGQRVRLTDGLAGVGDPWTMGDAVIFPTAAGDRWAPAAGGDPRPLGTTTVLAAWGSSTVSGLTSRLSAKAAAAGMTFYGGGIGGEVAETILARYGSRALIINAATIPASGPVTVTSSNAPTVFHTTFSFTGTLAGVAGTLAKAAGSAAAITFTRTAAGTATPVPAGTPFLPTLGVEHRNAVTILQAADNNLSGTVAGSETNVDVIEQWTAEAYSHAGTLGRLVLILGYWTDRDVVDGSPIRTRIQDYNARMAATYGQRFLDLGAYVTSSQVWTDTGITPTASDLSHQTRGNKPPSLSSDNEHLNTAGYDAVANLIGKRLADLGWVVPQTLAPDASGIIAADTFDRPNAASLGTSSSGHVWTTSGGTWSISGSRATGAGIAMLDSGAGDMDVSSDITFDATGVAGVVIHATDTSNRITFYVDRPAGGVSTPWTLAKHDAGSVIGYTSGTTSIPDGATVNFRLVSKGGVLTPYLNGVQAGSAYTMSAGDQTKYKVITRGGMRQGSAVAIFHDNFVIKTAV